MADEASTEIPNSRFNLTYFMIIYPSKCIKTLILFYWRPGQLRRSPGPAGPPLRIVACPVEEISEHQAKSLLRQLAERNDIDLSTQPEPDSGST